MTKTLEAVYDGQVLRPDEPLDLEPNTRVRVTIEVEDGNKEPYSFLRTASSLNLEGPPDWSTRVDYYLYETHRDEGD